MKILRIFAILLILTLLLFLTSGFSIYNSENGMINGYSTEDSLQILDSSKADEIVELAKSQKGLKEGNDGPFKGIPWVDSDGTTYCQRFVSAVIRVAYGETLYPSWHSGVESAYKDYKNHEGLIKTDKNPPKGALVFFDYWIEDENYGHVGICDVYDGNKYIISVESVGVTRKFIDFSDDYLGWISYQEYMGEEIPEETLPEPSVDDWELVQAEEFNTVNSWWPRQFAVRSDGPFRLYLDGNIILESDNDSETSFFTISNGTHRLELYVKGDTSTQFAYSKWPFNPTFPAYAYDFESSVGELETDYYTESTEPEEDIIGIEDLSFNPASPSQIGTSVNIYCRATWTEDLGHEAKDRWKYCI